MKSPWATYTSYCVCSLSNIGGILCIVVTASKTWAVLVFCPFPLGGSKKFLATKNVESSHRNGRVHILLALWIYFINCLWFKSIHLWNKRIVVAVRTYISKQINDHFRFWISSGLHIQQEFGVTTYCVVSALIDENGAGMGVKCSLLVLLPKQFLA